MTTVAQPTDYEARKSVVFATNLLHDLSESPTSPGL